MTTGRASARGTRAARARTRHGHASAPEVGARTVFPVAAPVVDVPLVASPADAAGAAGPVASDDVPAIAPAADAPADAGGSSREPTDDELDARARALLAGMTPLEDLVAERVPLSLVVDLVSPFGPDSERIAREERGR